MKKDRPEDEPRRTHVLTAEDGHETTVTENRYAHTF